MRRQMVTTMYNKFNYLIKACFPWMLCSSPQFEIWVILYISIHIGRYLAQKRFLNFFRLASFSVYRLTLIGENNRRNGNGGDQGGSYQCSDLIAIIMINYLSSKFILCSDIFNSYNPRDSENKLAVPLPWTNYYRNSFCHSGAVLWNSLPSDVSVQAKSPD